MNRRQFHEYFIKSYNEENDEGCFIKVEVYCPKELHELHNDLPFLRKNENWKSQKACY